MLWKIALPRSLWVALVTGTLLLLVRGHRLFCCAEIRQAGRRRAMGRRPPSWGRRTKESSPPHDAGRSDAPALLPGPSCRSPPLHCMAHHGIGLEHRSRLLLPDLPHRPGIPAGRDGNSLSGDLVQPGDLCASCRYRSSGDGPGDHIQRPWLPFGPRTYLWRHAPLPAAFLGGRRPGRVRRACRKNEGKEDVPRERGTGDDCRKGPENREAAWKRGIENFLAGLERTRGMSALCRHRLYRADFFAAWSGLRADGWRESGTRPFAGDQDGH